MLWQDNIIVIKPLWVVKWNPYNIPLAAAAISSTIAVAVAVIVVVFCFWSIQTAPYQQNFQPNEIDIYFEPLKHSFEQKNISNKSQNN